MGLLPLGKPFVGRQPVGPPPLRMIAVGSVPEAGPLPLRSLRLGPDPLRVVLERELAVGAVALTSLARGALAQGDSAHCEGSEPGTAPTGPS